MKLRSILCLCLSVSCNSADLAAPNSLQMNQAQDASASPLETTESDVEQGQPTQAPAALDAAVAEEALEPQSVAGAFLTCRSHGRDYENESSGVSCRYVSEMGQAPRADDGRVYAFKAFDSQTGEEFSVLVTPPVFPDTDWYLLVSHDRAIRSLDIVLRVSQQATAEELHQIRYRVPLLADESSLSLLGRYQNFVFGGGSYANTSGAANSCPTSTQIPIIRESIAIEIPLGGTNLSLEFAQVCDVGVPEIFRSYLQSEPRNLVELVQGEQVLQSWPIPMGQTQFTLRTTRGLAAGSYQLRVKSGQIIFKQDYAQFVGTAEFDNFGIGSVSIKSSLPIKLEDAMSKQSLKREFPQFFVRANPGRIPDGLPTCTQSCTAESIAAKSSPGRKIFDFSMQNEGDLSLMLRGICDMSSANNRISILNASGAVVFSDVLGSAIGTEVIQYSSQIKLPAGDYRLQVQGGVYRPQRDQAEVFDEFGVGGILLQGPLRMP